MKYGAAWKAAVAGLPPELQAACIPYAAWKKRTKGAVSWSSVGPRIASDCRRADVALDPSPPGWAAAACVLACRATRADVHPRDLIEYARLNSEALRKLCKRVDKRNGGTPDAGRAKSWLARCRELHLFSFLGGAAVARLELERAHAPVDCPVCFEPCGLPQRPALVTACGHVLCVPCAERVTGAGDVCGALQNRFSFVSDRWPQRCVCPLCRDRRAFQGLTKSSNVVVAAMGLRP